MSQLEYVRKLISTSEIHKEYPADEYLSYCAKIRTAVNGLSDGIRCPDVERFFQKRFVEEMETIGRIWRHYFGESSNGFQIQYLKDGFPDGTILYPTGKRLSIECTSAVDRRWENFALEQWRTKQRVVSLSGYNSKDLKGNRISGYWLKGYSIDDPEIEEYLCEADDEHMVKERHGEQIAEVIEKKLAKGYKGEPFWLSVYVNEASFAGWRDFMKPELEKIILEYHSRLAAQKILGVYFVGNSGVDEGFMSFHPIEMQAN